VLIRPRRSFCLRARRELERLAEEVQRSVVAFDDESRIDEALQRPGGGPRVESRLALHGGPVGRAEHEGGEHRPAVVVGEEADEFPRGEGRDRHAN
jgi:hypothetical protein